MHLSVIICTHNPREDYLRRTLEALDKQTLPKDQWELLLIDNASKKPLAGKWDLSWHPHGRHVSEEEVGLTPARLRGIRESKTKLLVLIDDDNVVTDAYLETALQLSENEPDLGVFGGSSPATYESAPPEWFHGWEDYIGVREVEKAEQSDKPLANIKFPIGAGMCIRANVAAAYVSWLEVSKGPLLDRCGNKLFGCGDLDMAFAATLVGLRYGVTPSLRLHHLIPSNRLELDYMINLVEQTMYSFALLQMKWGCSPPYLKEPGIRQRIRSLLFASPVDMSPRVLLEAAMRRGENEGWEAAKKLKGTHP